MNLKNERPSMLHSMILNFALNYSKTHSDFKFYNFFLLWNPKNLRYEDLHDGRNQNGENIPSLISRICREFVNSNTELDIEEFLNNIDNVIDQCKFCPETFDANDGREIIVPFTVFCKVSYNFRGVSLDEALRLWKTSYSTFNEFLKSVIIYESLEEFGDYVATVWSDIKPIEFECDNPHCEDGFVEIPYGHVYGNAKCSVCEDKRDAK